MIGKIAAPRRISRRADAKMRGAFGFKCQECGKKFGPKAAERATDHGCPTCGGTDIDLDVDHD